MSSSLSKKIITYDAVERYHDNLEEQLNNEYLRKDELIQSDWDCNYTASNEYIKNRTHYSGPCEDLVTFNLQDGWNSGDKLCEVDAYYFDDKTLNDTTKYFVCVTNTATVESFSYIPKDQLRIELPTQGPDVSATWHKVINDPDDPASDTYKLILDNNYSIDNPIKITVRYVYKQLNESYIPVSIARIDDVNDMLPIEKGTGENSIVQKGSNNIASGTFSVALGKDSNASGNYSFASGNSVASGEYSHAEGKGTQARGRASHTEGWYTIANNESEHASGKFNVSTKSSDKSQATQFSIGIGTSNTNRKNAFEVKQNGDIYVDGVEGRIQDRLNIDMLVPIQYIDLKKLRDQYKLIPGQKYRIIDYITTTTQENTTSALHPFDVIVTALDNRTLSENASAVKSGRDDDDYFYTENVEAWQLKYCLDNDTSRFAWADNNAVQWYSRIIANYIVDQGGTHTYSLDKDAYIYDFGTMPHPDTGEDTLVFYTQNPIYFEEAGADYNDIYFYNGITTVDGVEYDSWRKYSDAQWVNSESDGEGVYALTERIVYNGSFIWPDRTGIENGKGVIYRMIDEYGNDCPYDFKNIMFKHPKDTATYPGYYYTFTTLVSDVVSDHSFSAYCYNNVIKEYKYAIFSTDEGKYKYRNSLNKNVFINTAPTSICYGNSFGNSCYDNSFGSGCYDNSFGNYCTSNSFGNYCNSNSFGNSCNNNSFGSGCYYNSFGNDCYENYFLGECNYNSFEAECSNNSFGAECSNNSFGNYCYDNSFGNYCYYNSFGNYCTGNSFGNYCTGNSFGNSCYYNSFGNYCYGNSFGNDCYYNSFRISASKDDTLLNYCYYNHFDDGCGYNVIWNSVQPTLSNKLQNIHVVRGVSGTSSAYNFINVESNANYEIKVAKNSSGVIKIYCEADLIA